MHRRRFLTLSALAAAVGTAMPSSAEDPKSELHMPRDWKIHTGGSRMIDIGDSRHVWTKKVGSGETKVLLLHGGPGADHCYFECFEDFLPQNGIEFYYYDQLDSTNSDKPNDPALWTVERYRDEVEAVRKGLGLESFYLYGHSWGGMLAIEYALAYPQHLRGLVISNMTAGIQAYQKYAALLRSQLPVNVIAVLDKYEKAGDYKSPEYQQVVLEQVYSRHICRLNPWPEPLLRCFGHLNERVYNSMQGPNELVITGSLKNWERWNDLPRIRTRALTMGARYDEMNPDDMRRMAKLMPNAQAWISDTGSHMSFYDDQIPYFEALLTFLKSS